MIITNTEIVIYLDNAPEELLVLFLSKKVIVKAVKKSAAKKGAVAKNKKACNRLIIRL